MQWFGCCIDPSGGFENHLESFCSSPLFAVSGRTKCPEHLATRLILACSTPQSASVQKVRDLDKSEQRYGRKTHFLPRLHRVTCTFPLITDDVINMAAPHGDQADRADMLYRSVVLGARHHASGGGL